MRQSEVLDLSHFVRDFFKRRDPSAAFKCRHQKHPKYLRREFNIGHCLSHIFVLATAVPCELCTKEIFVVPCRVSTNKRI